MSERVILIVHTSSFVRPAPHARTAPHGVEADYPDDRRRRDGGRRREQLAPQLLLAGLSARAVRLLLRAGRFRFWTPLIPPRMSLRIYAVLFCFVFSLLFLPCFFSCTQHSFDSLTSTDPVLSVGAFVGIYIICVQVRNGLPPATPL